MILRIKKRNKAFSLIEILMAVSILSIGMVGVLGAYASSVESLDRGEENIEAFYLLRSKMVEIEQSILENEGKLSGASSGRFADEFEDFRWKWQLTNLEDDQMQKLVLTVSLEDESRQWTVGTYLFTPNETEE